MHPHIHGGILANRTNPDHLKTCEEHHIRLIDLVVVNLYPFEETVAKKDVSESEIIENIDIGGPTLLRAAAKNFQSVGVVVDPSRYIDVVNELKRDKELSLNTKKDLAKEAFSHVARYDSAIANYFQSNQSEDAKKLPYMLNPMLEKVSDLRYGENPHQEAALYQDMQNDDKNAFIQLQGKELSYNNLLDIESAINIVSEFNIPGAVVIKHTNPCGAAISDTLLEAYIKAHDADPTSAFGSIVGLNRDVDKKVAEELSKTFIEVVVATNFDDEALVILGKKKNLRLIKVELNKPTNNLLYKKIKNGFLVQTKDDHTVSSDDLNCVTVKSPTKKGNE